MFSINEFTMEKQKNPMRIAQITMIPTPIILRVAQNKMIYCESRAEKTLIVISPRHFWILLTLVLHYVACLPRTIQTRIILGLSGNAETVEALDERPRKS